MAEANLKQHLQKRDDQKALITHVAVELGFTVNYVQTVKDTIAKGATDEELVMFLHITKRTGLDPFARQIYAVKRYDSQQKKDAMSFQISIDGFRLIADRTKHYVPGRESTFEYGAGGKVTSATAYIKKWVGGSWHEICATAFYDEYVQTTKEGTPNRMWGKMPRTMLAKCAESLVLRKAFPAELSGLYTPEEMGTDLSATPPPPDPNNPPPLHLVTDPPAGEESVLATRKKTLAAICGELNKTGDKWTSNSALEYANVLFSSNYAALDEMTDTDFEKLQQEFQNRLAKQTAPASEQTVDAEVLDTEEPGDSVEAAEAEAIANENEPKAPDDDIPF